MARTSSLLMSSACNKSKVRRRSSRRVRCRASSISRATVMSAPPGSECACLSVSSVRDRIAAESTSCGLAVVSFPTRRSLRERTFLRMASCVGMAFRKLGSDPPLLDLSWAGVSGGTGTSAAALTSGCDLAGAARRGLRSPLDVSRGVRLMPTTARAAHAAAGAGQPEQCVRLNNNTGVHVSLTYPWPMADDVADGRCCRQR
eukprot:1286042-Prymnesium_polylepis.1